jgi:hypothetical protein
MGISRDFQGLSFSVFPKRIVSDQELAVAATAGNRPETPPLPAGHPHLPSVSTRPALYPPPLGSRQPFSLFSIDPLAGANAHRDLRTTEP